MDGLDDFHSVFGAEPNLAYHGQTIHEIHKHRHSLGNELFFDRLLRAIGIDKASKLYPPPSNKDLQNLYKRIVDSSAPDHQKQSLVYYILKDLSLEKHSPEAFAERSYIPGKYQTFIDGIWNLDRLKLERALDYLTSPTLIPTFPDEILHTLCQHAPKDDSTLPLAYFYSVSPPLASQRVLFALFERMCNASLSEAYSFSRGQEATKHHALFEQLIFFVHANSAGDTRASRALILIQLPLDEEEEVWFEEFLTSGKGHALQGAKDTVMMRKITKGRMGEAITFGQKMSGRKIDGVNWTYLREGLEKGSAMQ